MRRCITIYDNYSWPSMLAFKIIEIFSNLFLQRSPLIVRRSPAHLSVKGWNTITCQGMLATRLKFSQLFTLSPILAFFIEITRYQTWRIYRRVNNLGLVSFAWIDFLPRGRVAAMLRMPDEFAGFWGWFARRHSRDSPTLWQLWNAPGTNLTSTLNGDETQREWLGYSR